MNLWTAVLILGLVVTTAITCKLLVRRRAPTGGWFADPARAAGTLSLIGTMFSVMLAFVVVVALQSYQRAREGANVEAIAINELNSVAELFESPSRERLKGELVCYGRAVISDEWPEMGKQRTSALVQSWVDNMDRESALAESRSAQEQTAYTQWFDHQAQRREGRRERIAEATSFVPIPLWFVLTLGAALILSYMCLQADRREALLLQAIPIAFVSALMCAGLLMVYFLDHPYTNDTGSLVPTEMRRTLAIIEHGTVTP